MYPIRIRCISQSNFFTFFESFQISQITKNLENLSKTGGYPFDSKAFDLQNANPRAEC